MKSALVAVGLAGLCVLLCAQAMPLPVGGGGTAKDINYSDTSTQSTSAYPPRFVQWQNETTIVPRIGSFTTFRTYDAGLWFEARADGGNQLFLGADAGTTTWDKAIGILSNTAPSADYTVRTVLYGSGAWDNGTRVSIFARANFADPVITGYAFSGWATGSSLTYYLQRYNADGGFTDLKSVAGTSVGGGRTASDPMYLELQVQGQTVSASVNGVQMWRVYDSTFSAPGKAGVANFPASTGGNARANIELFEALTPTPPYGVYWSN